MLVLALFMTNTLIAVKASNCPAVDPHQEDVAEASVDHLRLFNKYQDNTKSMSYLPQVSRYVVDRNEGFLLNVF